MNATFIVTSFWAYGELLIGLEFAKRLKEHEYDIHFFIPPSHKLILEQEGLDYTILIPNAGAINRILFQDHELRIHPEFIILSDFLNYNFCERHYGLKKEDLSIFSGRLGTFDNFDWSLEKRPMDTYGFPASIASKVNVEDYGFQLIPCPIANSKMKNSKTRFYYPLIEQYIKYNEVEKRKERELLGISADQKIILLTSASWQETYKQYNHVVDFVNEVNHKVNEILQEMSQYAKILCIGSKNSYGLKQSENVMMLDSVAPKEFERYIKACDVFVSLNLTSTTLAKIACSGIPCLVLTHAKNGEQGSDYPYRMFPVGWYSFLEPVCRNNAYMNLLEEADVFQKEEVVSLLKKMVFEKDYRNNVKEKAKKYRSELEFLKKPEEILDILSKQ